MSLLNQLGDVLLDREILLLYDCSHGLKLTFEGGLQLRQIDLWDNGLAWLIFNYG